VFIVLVAIGLILLLMGRRRESKKGEINLGMQTVVENLDHGA
jgi:hypothetical protein